MTTDGSDKNGDGKTKQKNRSHILIREARSLSNFSELENPNSLESKIARGRGGGEIESSTTDNSSQSSSTDNTQDRNQTKSSSEDENINFSFNEGKISCKSGYMMHFIPPHYTHLSVYDIVSIPDNTAYPLTTETLNTLPKWALGQLHQNGHIRITGRYDKEEKSFKDVEEGWNSDKNPYDRIIELTRELDGDITSAVYYLANNHASNEYGHPSTIAESRGIKEDSVKESIRKVERLLSTKTT